MAKSKWAVVTGGTKGIGKSVIKKLASEGFNIITCARKEDELTQLKAEITQQYSLELIAHVVDMAIKKEVLAFSESINKKLKHVDLLVNNAGVFIPGEICHEKHGTLEMMINTNLYSAYHLTRGLVNGMIKHQSGHIFNMCSIASIIAYPNGGSYSISKFALYGMSKVLREELKPHGIRVTSVMPGATYTASWEGSGVEKGRLMKSEDIAEAIWCAYALSKNSVIEDLVIRPQLGDL